MADLQVPQIPYSNMKRRPAVFLSVILLSAAGTEELIVPKPLHSYPGLLWAYWVSFHSGGTSVAHTLNMEKYQYSHIFSGIILVFLLIAVKPNGSGSPRKNSANGNQGTSFPRFWLCSYPILVNHE
jgi:hypothetical protein